MLATSARVAGSTADAAAGRTRAARRAGGRRLDGAGLPAAVDRRPASGAVSRRWTPPSARALGLVTRPLEETLRDTLAYEETRTVPRKAGLTDDDERRVQEAVLSR